QPRGALPHRERLPHPAPALDATVLGDAEMRERGAPQDDALEPLGAEAARWRVHPLRRELDRQSFVPRIEEHGHLLATETHRPALVRRGQGDAAQTIFELLFLGSVAEKNALPRGVDDELTSSGCRELPDRRADVRPL